MAIHFGGYATDKIVEISLHPLTQDLDESGTFFSLILDPRLIWMQNFTKFYKKQVFYKKKKLYLFHLLEI